MATKHDVDTRLLREIYRDKGMALYRRRPHALREALRKADGARDRPFVRPPEIKH